MFGLLSLDARRTASLLFLVALFAGALTMPAAVAGRGRTQSPGSDTWTRLARKAEHDGSVRVIVSLRSNFVPEGRLSPAAAKAQRAGIERVQAGLRGDLAGTDYRVLHAYKFLPAMALSLSPRALAAARRSQHVDSVAPDRLRKPFLGDSVPIVEGTTMWSAGFTGSGKTVAVLDTGVDKAHTFLSGKVVEEACFSGGSDCPNNGTSQTGSGSGVPCTYAPSACRHGTHVAGIAAGKGASFSGVAKDASVMSVQVFSSFTGSDCIGSGEDPCALSFDSDQIAGLQRVFAVRGSHDFASVNLSLGGGQFFSTCDAGNATYKAAIDNLRSNGIATIIASGNNGFTNSMAFPACISTAISVGSTTKSDAVSSFSNSASFLSLLAPGSDINSSVPGGTFESFNGTSMATPHVAGAWALMEQANPAATVSDILSDLQSTGVPVTDTRPGGTQTKPRICIAAAAGLASHDDFADSLLIPGSTAALTDSNGCATKEAGEPLHAGNAGGKSVWYRWTAPANGSTTIDTTGSNFDTLLGVYTGGAVNALTEIASNDDEVPGSVFTSKVTFTATSGTIYRIAVDGFNGDMAGIKLNLAGPAGGTNQPPVAVNDSLTTSEDAANAVDVLANDSDPDGDTLSVTTSTQGAHGSVGCTAAGLCTYTPAADFHGADSFTYTADDGNGGTDIGTVSVTVNSVADDVARAVTLRLRRHLKASGKVTATPDTFEDCTDGVSVKIQRKKRGRWRTVKSATTNSNGGFNVTLADKPGTYRALAPAATAGGDDCGKATSSTKRHQH